jgi:leucyl/phenylalanyl-tRNA--protein transferase
MFFSLPKDELIFPDPALANEDGLLAIGGDLSPGKTVIGLWNGHFSLV